MRYIESMPRQLKYEGWSKIFRTDATKMLCQVYFLLCASEIPGMHYEHC